MHCGYTLEWLDTAVEVKLHHGSCNRSAIRDDELSSLIADIELQGADIRHAIKEQVFGCSNESQAEALVRQYYAAMMALYDTSVENAAAFAAFGGLLADACNLLPPAIDGLLVFLEHWYHKYIALDERVPATLGMAASVQIQQQLERLVYVLEKDTEGSVLIQMVCEELAPEGNRSEMTFRELLYRKDLLRQLEASTEVSSAGYVAKAIDDVLIYMNFNSQRYIDFFTKKMAGKLGAVDGSADKIGLLLAAMKEFNQARRRESVRLNVQDADLKTTICNWFSQELEYLERSQAIAGHGVAAHSPQKEQPQKFLCSLSVDQIALLIRSADESKILVCRSVNAAFRTLVPYLSTELRQDISPDSMRSKSYSAERKDKDVVIARLEQMIAMIRNY